MEADYAKRLQEARDAAVKRESVMRDDANRARSAAYRLSLDLSDANRRVSELSATACHERAVTLSNVFESCVGEVTTMAESCDRHINDKQTLMEGWPQKSQKPQ